MATKAKRWVVEFDSDAVVDFEDVKARGDRKAVFNVVQKLKDLGPDLPRISTGWSSRRRSALAGTVDS